MPSFDVVSEIDQHELTNTIDQANREISNRFDFKDTDSNIETDSNRLMIRSASINGIEFSCRWQNQTIHIVGLNIDEHNHDIVNTTANLRNLRETRAIKIGDKLAKAGIHGIYEKAKRLAGNGNVTRQHYAYVLVEAGYAKTLACINKLAIVTRITSTDS